MFEVLSKKTGSTITVYAAEEDRSGYVKLLVYEDNGWRWRSAKHYKPLDKNERVLPKINPDDGIVRYLADSEDYCPSEIGLADSCDDALGDCRMCWSKALSKIKY